MRLPTIAETFLAQFVLYLLLWILNPYLAGLLSLIFGGVILVILLISLIVEWIEPSKVPRSYFRYMAVCVLAPALAAGLYQLVQLLAG